MNNNEVIMLLDLLFKEHAADIIEREKRLLPNKTNIKIYCFFYEIFIFIMTAEKYGIELEWIDKTLIGFFEYSVPDENTRIRLFKTFQKEFAVFHKYDSNNKFAEYFTEYFYKKTHTHKGERLFYDAVEKLEFLAYDSTYLTTIMDIYDNWFKENIKEIKL